LCFIGIEEKNRIVFYVEYSTKLFKRERIETYVGYYKEIVSIVKDNPSVQLLDIKIIRDVFNEKLDNPEMELAF
jgi:hypothetical protein